MKRPQESPLTSREQDVLVLVARGFTNQEIAKQLFVTTSAVKICLHQACVKLGARNRAQAVILALKRGAIDLREFYSLEELADLLAWLGPEAIEAIAQLLKRRHQQDQTLPNNP